MKKESYDKLSKKIIAAYCKNSSCLKVPALGHFFVRAYKVTGNKEYAKYIAKSFEECRLKRIKSAAKIIQEKKYPLKPFDKKIKNIRSIKRLKLYEKKPEISFFDLLLIDLLYTYKFGLHKNLLKKEYQSIISLLKSVNFKKIYLNKKTIEADSSYSINTIHLLKRFRIIDLTNELEKTIRKIYLTENLLPKNDLRKVDFCSLIYDLTHIIISNTLFYEQKTKNYQWITSFFSDNIKSIEQNVTEDILAEIGLCFKLQGKNNHPVLKNIQRTFLDNWPWKKLSNKNFLVEKEHTNSLLVLLFSKNDPFYPGPEINLS